MPHLLDVTSYDVALDLAADEETFGSRHHDPVPQPRRPDLPRPQAGRAHLGPARRAAARRRPARARTLPARDRPRASTSWSSTPRCRSATTARGCTAASTRPTAGTTSTAMTFMDAAPTIFACFDQPDLKAPYTLHVRAPQDWMVIGNAPGHAGRAGRLGVRADASRCRPTSSPWSPGPTTCSATSTTASRSGCSARASIAAAPRQGRRRAVHADQAVLRRVPPALRDPLPVRRLPPGVRARSSTPARWRTRAA